MLKQIYLKRRVSSSKELDYSLTSLLPPDGFSDTERASGLVSSAIENGERILILGDYDTDGATATALGYLALTEMGASSVDYLVPNRMEYGYGLSPEIAEVAISRAPDIVITVDNGISSIEGVSALRNADIKVLVTDHHLAGEILPDANAILNPNQPGCMFPGKSLAGVGVMFYLLMMVRSRLRESGWFDRSGITLPNLGQYLDLVALGTVADVVPLDHNNRILVSQGLSRIRKARCRPGILALLEAGGRHYTNIVSSDFGFVVAPRLNAAGRLDDISTGIECLITPDSSKARRLASVLNEINQERKEIEHDMQVRAMEIVDDVIEERKAGTSDKSKHTGYILFDDSWHQGITGLVASRVKERTGVPVIAFANTSNAMLTGSARSVQGFHIKDCLEEIATANPALIEKFGGHAMAAGLTIHPDNLGSFESHFCRKVSQHYEKNQDNDLVWTDGFLDGAALSLETAELVKHAAPWGQGFPVPLFHGLFRVRQCRVVGGIHLKLSLLEETASRPLDAIMFRALDAEDSPPALDRIRIAYQLDVNEYGGRKSLQLIIEYLEIVDS